MAADSIRTISDHLVQRIHSGSDLVGKLHRGHGITAATASIPSKYQTIVIDNSERRGFGRCSKRFDYELTADENPGPGTYGLSRHIQTQSNESSSKKGTGGFASKDKRTLKLKLNNNPGAGSYHLPSYLFSRNDFCKSSSTGAFAQPIAVQREKVKKIPAPNSYEVLRANLGPRNNVTANAAFKSKSKREVIDIREAQRKPAPGQYDVNESLLHHSVKVPFSSFRSTSLRKMAQTPVDNPGPGTYSPENPPKTPVNRQEVSRKHYLCISAPAMPLPPALPGPGPGAYELINYEGEPPHYMSGAVFVSNTSRWTGQASNDNLPGPAHYRPTYQSGKQSFIYNAQGKWI